MCNIFTGEAWFPYENAIHKISTELEAAFVVSECLVRINIENIKIMSENPQSYFASMEWGRKIQ